MIGATFDPPTPRSPSPEEIERTIAAQLTDAGFDPKTIERCAASTIVPPTISGESADRVLSLLGGVTPESLIHKLDLHEPIGEGGMGIVHLGTQRSMARDVAVKMLKPELRSPHATVKLLREAWVTGRLEHPNVVPVHDVALADDGSPLVVLKRIAGTSWLELINDAAEVRARFGPVDLLEWNLRTLMQVCNAVHYAHSQGIVHRDLKPENVLIGQFGEVYVADWGIAVSLRDDGTGRLPLAKDATQLAGTLAYMAPEMIGGGHAQLSERTDVYLLGAILYEIVSGDPPHRGDGLPELVAQILDSNPEIPIGTPSELRQILRRAMNPTISERFPTVGQFRLAIQDYLLHRDAGALTSRAAARLGELHALIEKAAMDVGRQRGAIYHLYGECHFGFRHALEVWPDSDSARTGLRAAAEAMARFELAHGEPGAAHAVLGEIPDPSPALVKEVETALQSRRQEEAIAPPHHAPGAPTSHTPTRFFTALGLASLWCALPLLAQVLLWTGAWNALPNLVPIGIDLGLLVGLAAMGTWTRGAPTPSLARSLSVSGWIAGGATIVLHTLDMASPTPDAWTVIRQAFAVWGVATALLATRTNRSFLLPAAGFAIAYAVVGAQAEWALFAMCLVRGALVGTAAWAWRRGHDSNP